MMANRSDRVRQRSMKRCELLSSSPICPAVDPRKPSGPAAVSPRFKAGYTTASAVFTVVNRNPLQSGGGPYTSFCSSSTAPISRVMLASFGKMPTTPAFAGAGAGPPLDLLVQAFQWVGGVQLGAVLSREGHVGQHVVLASVHQRAQLGPARPQLVGDVPPGLVRRIGVGFAGRAWRIAAAPIVCWPLARAPGRCASNAPGSVASWRRGRG